jgi:hypothetical protein
MNHEAMQRFSEIFKDYQKGNIGFDDAKEAMVKLLSNFAGDDSGADFSIPLPLMEKEPLLKEVFKEYIFESMKEMLSKVSQEGPTE